MAKSDPLQVRVTLREKAVLWAEEALLTAEEVSALVGRRPTWLREHSGLDFPPQVSHQDGRWLRSQVVAWMRGEWTPRAVGNGLA